MDNWKIALFLTAIIVSAVLIENVIIPAIQRPSDVGDVFPSNAVLGALFFRTDWDKLCFYNGTTWLNLTKDFLIEHSYIKESHFIIQNVSGIIKAFNGHGVLAYSGTNFVTVTQSAINEGHVICFKGNFTIDSSMMNDLPLKIPSYRTLQFDQCHITYSGTNKSKNIIKNADTTKGNVHIIIEGGFFHGQRGTTSFQDTESVGYQSVGNCILWMKVNNSRISYTSIKSFAGNALGVHTARNNTYEYIIAEDCGGYGQFEQSGEEDSFYLYCRAFNSNDGDSMGVDGFDWCSYTYRDTFMFCEAINNTYNGFSDFNAGTTKGKNLLTGCRAIGNAEEGFYICGEDVLIECLGKNNGLDGLRISLNGDNCRVIGGRFCDDQAVKTQDRGIRIDSGADNVTIIGVDVRGNKDYAISGGGTSAMIKACIGFKTESRGMASDCVNGSYVSHDLASTPDVIMLTIMGNSLVNSTCHLLAPTIIASNSTHFQIGFYKDNNGVITSVTATNQRSIYWIAEYKS